MGWISLWHRWTVPKPIKDFLEIDEQISRLRSRGMSFSARSDALRWLTAVNYYRLSGYSYPYRQILPSDGGRSRRRSDHFVRGTSFDSITALYEFDRKLRSLVLDGLERVEVAVRSTVSHHLGRQNPLAHEDPALFRPTFDHASWWRTAERRLSRARRHSEFVKHHEQEYGGKVPIWVLVEVLDFADVSRLYDDMLTVDQYAAAESLGIRVDTSILSKSQRAKALKGHPFARWLEQLTVVRNTAAHHGRLWNHKFPPVSTAAFRTLPGLEDLPDGQSERLYGALCMIAFELRTLSPGSKWPTKVSRLIRQDLRSIPGRTETEMGFPDRWEQQVLWRPYSS